MLNLCVWRLCAHVYLISLNGSLLLFLLLSDGVVLLLKFLQLFLADLLRNESRKKNVKYSSTVSHTFKISTNNCNYLQDENLNINKHRCFWLMHKHWLPEKSLFELGECRRKTWNVCCTVVWFGSGQQLNKTYWNIKEIIRPVFYC